MNNPVVICFMQTDDPNFNPQKDPTPEGWDNTMPPVKPHITKVEDFDTQVRLVFPGLDIWIPKQLLELLR